MLLSNIPVKEGSLGFVKGLLCDKKLKTYGVSYTNSFFSQRYLCRQHLLNKVEFTDDSIKLVVATRLEQIGLLEIENTLDMLVKHQAGDIPGLMPEGLLDPEDDKPTEFLPEAVSVTQYLTSVDLLLIMKNVEVTYQIFNIAGSKFTLVSIRQELEEGFEQTVTLLFGKAGKMYLFSHFYNKELSTKDMKIILDLIMDENITGKAIIGMALHALGDIYSNVFPFDRLISSYTTAGGDYVFGDGSGYIYINRERLDEYTMTCTAEDKGNYMLKIEYKTTTILIHFE